MSEDRQLARIAEAIDAMARALDTLAGRTDAEPELVEETDAYHWDGASHVLVPVERVNRVPLALLRGVEPLKAQLLENTLQFARGFGANNVLLWGARGMGKSSLVKAVHAEVGETIGSEGRLILIEINREDIGTLPALLRFTARQNARFIIFCDDLSFDRDETSYKALKTVLDGGLEGRPANTLFYATSNRRHLMAREMVDNERATAINPGEAVDEKVSLSDRFGLWLGFHNCDQDTYLAMVGGYVEHYGIEIAPEDLRARAIEWAMTRGGRSGRVAIQFVRDLAGKMGLAAQ